MSIDSPAYPGPKLSASRDPLSARAGYLQNVFDNITDMVVLIRREGEAYRFLEANQAVSRMEGIAPEAMVGKRVDEFHPPEAYARWKALYDGVIETGLPVETGHEAMGPRGMRSRITKVMPFPGEGDPLLMCVCRDVTEAKAAAAERDAHLRHLEALNRIGLILSENLDVEKVLQRTTEALVEIFSADRAWIANSCDPDAPSFEIKFITSRAEYPGPPPGSRLPMDAVSREIVREVIATEGPIAYDPTHPMPGGEPYRALYGIQSQILMALRIRDGETWCIGLHQCSHERSWEEGDRALYRDIVHRIKDSLRNLLLHRDLKESRELYHVMSEGLPQLLWTTDADGKVVFVNRRWMEYTGQSWERSLSGGGLDAIHPEDLDRCVECWRRSRESGDPYEVELRYRRADGAYLWHLTRAYPIRDPEGSILSWVGTCTDISEAKRVLESEARSRRELDVILQGVDEGIAAQDPTGKLIYANQRYAEFSGFPSPEALLSSPLEERKERYEFLDEAGNPLPWQALPGRRVLQGEDHVELVMHVKDRKLGTQRWMHSKSTSVRGSDGRILMAINFSQDITSIREAREELLKSRTQLSTILSGIGESIIAYDADGKVIYLNAAAAKLLDQPSADELLKVTSQPPLSEEDRYYLFDEKGGVLPPERLPSRIALGGVEPQPLVMRVRRGLKGKERCVLARAKPIFDAEGKVSLVISIAQDITELREKEESVRQLQKMESLGKLAGGIAHDFNNLLVTINGYSELGIHEAGGMAVLEEYFREILRSGQRAAALTQQLLAYSRRQIVHPVPLGLNDAVGNMDKMLRRLIGEDIHVRTLLEDRLPPVHADPNQLEQVILNLVVNARDAMPKGGVLTLETGARRLEEKDLLGNPEAKPGNYVFLKVSDTGVGMTPEVMERAFEPFFTTKEIGKGTGLGLASVYGIVKQYGGHIAVQSAPGAGSVFTIHLPVLAAHAEKAVPASQARGIQASRGSATLLLVEDEESVRNFTRLVLESHGYAVVVARNGKEALAEAGKLPDLELLISDVVMPSMSGTALVEEIRKSKPGLKVLLISGYREPDRSPQGDPGQATGFIQKPFKVEDLIAQVEKVLRSETPA